MKQLSLIILSIVGVLLVSGCGTNTTTTDTDTLPATDTEQAAVIPEAPTQDDEAKPEVIEEDILDGKEISSTMKNIMKKGKPATCTFSQTTEDGTTVAGTLYVEGEKMRTVTKGNVGGQTIDMNMILNDGYLYTWSSFEPGKGYKIKNTSEGVEDTNTENAGEMDKEMMFSCKGGVENGVFDIPNDIQFGELDY